MADEPNDLPYQTVESPSSTWVEISTAATEEDARLIQGFLEAEGIPCQIESLEFHMAPVNFGKLGEIRVYVDKENEATAVELLQRREVQYDSLRDDESVVTDEGPAAIQEDAQTVPETEE